MMQRLTGFLASHTLSSAKKTDYEVAEPFSQIPAGWVFIIAGTGNFTYSKTVWPSFIYLVCSNINSGAFFVPAYAFDPVIHGRGDNEGF